MSTYHDRTTPKEIKAWCIKTWAKQRKTGALSPEDIIELMFKAYKRGYNDALSG